MRLTAKHTTQAMINERNLTKGQMKELKLSQLEDIEDELGFSITKLLLIEKVWFKWENGQFQRVYIYGVDIKRKLLLGKMSNRPMTLKLKDYGKTWALTKEVFHDSKM